jgi:hypothetical protein
MVVCAAVGEDHRGSRTELRTGGNDVKALNGSARARKSARSRAHAADANHTCPGGKKLGSHTGGLGLEGAFRHWGGVRLTIVNQALKTENTVGSLIRKQVLQRITCKPAKSGLRISISPPPHHASRAPASEKLRPSQPMEAREKSPE